MIPQRKPERARLLSTSICDCALYPSSGSCGGLTGGEGHPFKKIFKISKCHAAILNLHLIFKLSRCSSKTSPVSYPAWCYPLSTIVYRYALAVLCSRQPSSNKDQEIQKLSSKIKRLEIDLHSAPNVQCMIPNILCNTVRDSHWPLLTYMGYEELPVNLEGVGAVQTAWQVGGSESE